ncbi:HK97 gp10 family phage protein [Rhizobium leguminosarum]|uniref:HK97 gp10 family phage protein n=1 Tax=Rhizobium leguminosarum TaxID=384 RepID=UPI001C988D22|nr:HK97 gp10 family phage protein [Rhizobium leguminosarum]MBY5698526.1 HK97 gp10 family phage protein [Rhizobium leguminosarum]
MAITADLKGREALMRRLNQLAPNVEKYAAQAKLEIGKDAAKQIAANAPRDTGDYADSFKAELVSANPDKATVGISVTKDPSAVGIYASYIFRFLEFGTAPHSTVKGGGTVLGKKTAAASGAGIHPGTPAQAHVFPTWRSLKKKARKRLLAAVNKGVREAMGKT